MFVVRVRVPRTSAETSSSDYERYEGRRTEDAAAKSNVALLSLAQAKPHEARRRKCLRSSVVSSFLVFFFPNLQAHR